MLALYHDVKLELRRVTWPQKREVLLVSAFVGTFGIAGGGVLFLVDRLLATLSHDTLKVF
jgi:preprotein translocase SecE subunit